jgi:hypothetical protein
MGMPPISTNGFPGNLDDWYRAGIIPITFIAGCFMRQK